MTATADRADYIAQARLVKATRLAAVLREVGCDADTLARLDADARARAERVAGVHPASEATWALVATLLAG